MKPLSQFHRNRAPLAFAARGNTPNDVRCAFCGHDDLVVAGPRRATFLGCPRCGADGPPAEGLDAAVALYLARPAWPPFKTKGDSI